MSANDQIHPVKGGEKPAVPRRFQREACAPKKREMTWKQGKIYGGDSNSIGGHEKRSGRTTFCVQRDEPHKTPLFTGLRLESTGDFIRR